MSQLFQPKDYLEKNALNTYMKEFSQSQSAIRRMDNIAREMTKKYGDEAVHNFSLGNPRVPPPEKYDEIMIETIKDKNFFLPHGYASNVGDNAARRAVAKLFSKIQEVEVPYEYVCLTSGCASAINIFLRSVLSIGDEVIVFSPYFLEYPYYVDNYGGKIVECKTTMEDGWQINREKFREKITALTRVVIINSPQNPTGVIYNDKTIKIISEICFEASKKYGRPIWILSDDVYCRILRPGEKCHQIFKHYKFSAISYSVSKDLSLPGERIGALIICPSLETGQQITHAASIANEYLSIYPPNRLHMRALPKLLEYTSDIKLYDESQKIIEETLKELDIKYVKPQGSFYIFPKIPDGLNELEFCENLIRNFIVVVPGSAFHSEGYYRLAFCKPPESIKKGMEVFKTAYKKVCEEMKAQK